MPYTGHRRLPRPQNPAGSAWRLVNVHEGVEALVRVTTLVRSRTPTSDEAFHPPRSLGPLVIHTGTAAGSPQGWSRGDSNPGPPPCKGGALPAKLRPPGLRRPRPRRGGRAWTRTRDLGLIRAALSPPELRARRTVSRPPQRRRAPGSPGDTTRPLPKTERAERARTQRICQVPHVAPPTSPTALAPLPGPATVWRRENLGARCPALPDPHPAT